MEGPVPLRRHVHPGRHAGAGGEERLRLPPRRPRGLRRHRNTPEPRGRPRFRLRLDPLPHRPGLVHASIGGRAVGGRNRGPTPGADAERAAGLRRADGTLVAAHEDEFPLGSVAANLPAGSYRLGVSSASRWVDGAPATKYGEVGRYTVRVQGGPDAQAPFHGATRTRERGIHDQHPGRGLRPGGRGRGLPHCRRELAGEPRLPRASSTRPVSALAAATTCTSTRRPPARGSSTRWTWLRPVSMTSPRWSSPTTSAPRFTSNWAGRT